MKAHPDTSANYSKVMIPNIMYEKKYLINFHHLFRYLKFKFFNILTKGMQSLIPIKVISIDRPPYFHLERI